MYVGPLHCNQNTVNDVFLLGKSLPRHAFNFCLVPKWFIMSKCKVASNLQIHNVHQYLWMGGWGFTYDFIHTKQQNPLFFFISLFFQFGYNWWFGQFGEQKVSLEKATPLKWVLWKQTRESGFLKCESWRQSVFLWCPISTNGEWGSWPRSVRILWFLVPAREPACVSLTFKQNRCNQGCVIHRG